MALVCTNCGHVGIARRITPGSILIELCLWGTGLLTIIFGIGLLILVAALVYSLWRISARYYACAACLGRNLVPDNTPAGRRIIEQNRSGLSSS